MKRALASLCAAHGIAPSYLGLDEVERRVPEATLARLVQIFGLQEGDETQPPGGIEEALAESSPLRCYVPESLRDERCWGLTCQLPALASPRNLGMGDFADLAALCRLAAAEGADFVGTNPLHALFWSDPGRISPFFPSHRRFLNPLFIAVDWVAGFDGLTEPESSQAQQLRKSDLIDSAAVAQLKDRVLHRLFARFARTADAVAEFDLFCERGGAALEDHAVFEALSVAMTAKGHGVGWPSWPEALQQRGSPEVAAFADRNRDAVRFHLWLQWQAAGQVQRVQREAQAAGMRVGLYLDFAVGAAPDGSAAWSDPALTVPGAAIGAPPDDFNADGQDWGLAPLSPATLARLEGQPIADILTAVMQTAGAMRIDHAMSLARLWLIPRGLQATEGAYVHYPLSQLLERVAEASRLQKCLVIGEDLGVVPKGFRPLLAERDIHTYKVFFFDRDADGFGDPADWPAGALACLATHDMPTFAGWWRGRDLPLRRRLGLLSAKEEARERRARAKDRAAIQALVEPATSEAEISARLHAHMADSPCRLAALQIEDALGVEAQVNVPGTTDEYPNWRGRLPVPLDSLADHARFQAHCASMRAVRPR